MKKTVLSVSAFALCVAGALPAVAEPVFNRIASFPVASNMPAGTDPKTVTSAEIISATDDGMMLIYTDSPMGVVGMIDIADPKLPKAAGVVKLDGEPTSVAVSGKVALIAVNRSKSKAEPGGALEVLDIAGKTVAPGCDLGGQPDSVAVSPDRSIVAVAIENERDEEVNDGEMPQMPAGNVTIFNLKDGVPDCATRKVVDLTGLYSVAVDDPEPEFLDINAANEILVTLQENNHIAIIDGATGTVKQHGTAGTVDLANVDVKEEGALTFDGKLDNVPREPDSIKWLDANRFVMANEGDYKGGSRGFTIMNRDGSVAYDSGLSLEYEAARLGHYPEGRSGNKGIEPEGIEVARFGDQTLFFVLAERASLVGVYEDTGAEPRLLQVLPSGVGPEGAKAIPARNLFVTANETDLVEDQLARSHVMIYERAEGTPSYPHLVSGNGANGRPIAWVALSGLVADTEQPGILYAVNDSYLGLQPTIFTIDANQKPARIIGAIPVTRGDYPAQKLDIEGIVGDGKGGFYLASEGRTDRVIPHAIYHVNADGQIKTEIGLPDALMGEEIRFGFEGVTKIGSGDDTHLVLAVQREWRNDPKGMVKLLTYSLKAKEWGAVHYPLDAAEKGWVGLSEITAYGDHLYIVERDNQIDADARIKKLYRVALSELKPAKLGETLPVVKKEMVRDFLPDLLSTGGYALDKIEGFAIDSTGTGFVVTDNDGVDDSSGETMFWSIGKM